MSFRVDNAIILAAGLSSRFVPLSIDVPKSLLKVKGEILIERQIKQLQEAGIKEIIVVVGYKKELFYYLRKKYNVIIVENNEFMTRNNHSSIFAVQDFLHNTYICSGDNYYKSNPFEMDVDASYYSVVYAVGQTDEWCIKEDADGYINHIKIGGADSWYLLGHAFWSNEFSRKISNIISSVYNQERIKEYMWEHIYMENIELLPLKARRYPQNTMFEFDSLDELRAFDETYKTESGSKILKKISKILDCFESDLHSIKPSFFQENDLRGFYFMCKDNMFEYDIKTGNIHNL